VLLINVTKIAVWMLNYRVLLLNHVLLVWYVRMANASVSFNEPDCFNYEFNNFSIKNLKDQVGGACKIDSDCIDSLICLNSTCQSNLIF